jgi:hypothetical protein
MRFTVEDFFPTSRLTHKGKKISTDTLPTRTKFLRYINQVPRSTFKKLIVTMPTLLQGLHQMSLLKSVPEGLKPRECERVKLCEPPPVPYIPTKDEVQDEVAKMRNLKIKTMIKKDTTLNFQVWHENGTREAFLMQVTAVLNAIKKRGYFNNYKKAEREHEESKKVVESAKAALSLLDGTGAKAKRLHEKKTKEAKKDATAKVLDSESDTKEAKDAPEANDKMKAGSLEDLEKAKQAQRTARTRWPLPQTRCSRSIRTCFLQRVNMLGTRSSSSRWKVTRTSTYKVTLWTAQRECLASRLTIA